MVRKYLTTNHKLEYNYVESKKRRMKMDISVLKNKKVIGGIISLIVTITLVIVFFATDLSAMVFNNEEYKAYKYAIECVSDELRYPDSATYPSFKEVEIEKSSHTTSIIIGSYTNGKSIKKAWDISGSGTCENALGMTMNYKFNATVVLDEYGDYWCYECYIS